MTKEDEMKVIRVLVYRGNEHYMNKQLETSLPVGNVKRVHGDMKGQGGVSISVYQVPNLRLGIMRLWVVLKLIFIG